MNYPNKKKEAQHATRCLERKRVRFTHTRVFMNERSLFLLVAGLLVADGLVDCLLNCLCSLCD